MSLSKEWESFLTLQVLQERIISASLFLAAFETLKNNTVDKIKSFYSLGFDESGIIYDEESYKARVLSKNKSPIYASLEWLLEFDAINKNDIENFTKLKNIRNSLAHQMPAVIMTGNKFDHRENLSVIFQLLSKIDRWWVLNVEIPTNPDYDGQEIPESEVESGAVMMLQIMIDVAYGNDAVLQEFKKHHSSKK